MAQAGALGPRLIYRRLESGTQSLEAAAMQEASGEIWGRPAQNTFASDFPKAKAYEGPLPEGARGVEFATDVPPDSGHKPGIPTWGSLRGMTDVEGVVRPGVVVEDGFAKIKVEILKNTQTPTAPTAPAPNVPPPVGSKPPEVQ